MTSLNLCQVEAEKELVVEDQTTDPFIMRPSSHSWESGNWPNVEEEEDKSTSTSWESFIVWRYLLWTNSVVKKFHILKLTEYKWIGISVIWMFVSFLHVSEFITVIRLSISLLVLWLSLWSSLFWCLTCSSLVCLFKSWADSSSSWECSHLSCWHEHLSQKCLTCLC